MIVSSAFAAFVPMFIYLLLIWRFDQYDREPFLLILRNYLWGALGAIFFALLGSSILSFFVSIFIHNKESLTRIETIIIAPLVEETTKGIFLFFTVTGRRFDNMTDGIVYGGAIGLGFGMTENFLYFIANTGSINTWLMIVLIRTLFTSVMHCVSTATLGAFLGYAKFKNLYYKLTFPFLGLASAILIHFSWNLMVTFEKTEPLGFLFMFITILIFIVVFSISVSNDKRIIYNELLEEAKNGLIPMNHLPILNSSKRNNFGWIDEKIRKLYIQAATTLAFRKMQLRNTSGYNRLFYENDVLRYRTYIQDLLTGTK
ncbi:MAG: PrsW family intramembrane metalloprotease [Ignavibacteriaceae bacterium]|nr:PrsW family intramembrane metalloprotease [Ignavibacteriaceae bacterium]